MKPNSTIEILAVANGFVVSPGYCYDRSVERIEGSERHVFQTFAELSEWLSAHFDHRLSFIAVDV